jgi:seryl-tRNA synthetase
MDLAHERRLTEVEAKAKSNAHRLDEVEKKQDDLSELVGTVKVLATKEAMVEADVKEIKNDVKLLTNKPAKKWELIVTESIKILVAAVFGFILAKFGF